MGRLDKILREFFSKRDEGRELPLPTVEELVSAGLVKVRDFINGDYAIELTEKGQGVVDRGGT